ncbi:MAG: 3-oxoacyl-[acyl-carrier protein] reductase [Thermoanaerobacteraceae bacterium]|jgi:glucose 1-dehydrogenase|nr:3-oxoacyl-[acyl-carrier protein] reductase [Thermoanaerobacteraceae bacterium]
MDRKKAIVTGGSSGIGRGIVYALADEGYDVVFSYRNNEESAHVVLSRLREKHPDGTFACYKAHLDEAEAGKHFFRQAVDTLQGLDLMVNNAGVTILESLFDLTEDTTNYLLNLMLCTYVRMMKEAATYMASRQIAGSIINISSTRSISAHPGDAIYGGIKAALNRIIKSFALDAAPYGIRINNVLPGATRRFTPEEEKIADPAHLEKIKYLSKRIPLERYGTPEDVANLVIFLASDKASYITGQSISVDGGLSLPGLAETAKDAKACGWGRVKKKIVWESGRACRASELKEGLASDDSKHG